MNKGFRQDGPLPSITRRQRITYRFRLVIRPSLLHAVNDERLAADNYPEWPARAASAGYQPANELFSECLPLSTFRGRPRALASIPRSLHDGDLPLL